MTAGGHAIAVAGAEDLGDLLPLMRAYCDFYEVDPTDAALVEMSRALIADPRDQVPGAHVVIPVNCPPVMFSTCPWT